MSRQEFMRQLEKLLQSIPEAERQEALQYYNDYFDDAGVENEKEVLEALGNPAKVAENIKRDLYGDAGVQSSTVKHPPMADADANRNGNTGNDSAGNGKNHQNKEKKGFFTMVGEKFDNLPGWGKVLVLLGCIVLAPMFVSLASAVLGMLLGLVVSWFSLIFGFAVTAIVLIALLFFLVIMGFMCAVSAPFGGVALVGAGLLCGGLGILFLMLTVAMIGIVTPAICKAIASIYRSIFGIKEAIA